MIRRCNSADIERIYEIINEAARAYEGFIANDCYHQPYMPMDELQRERERLEFYGWEEDGNLVGVMGIEPIKDVTLIRHAYVLPDYQHRGIGKKLLEHLKDITTTRRLLVGTWAGARWAIDFYCNHDFVLLPDTKELLKKYQDIPPRQVETSVVMGMELR